MCRTISSLALLKLFMNGQRFLFTLSNLCFLDCIWLGAKGIMVQYLNINDGYQLSFTFACGYENHYIFSAFLPYNKLGGKVKGSHQIIQWYSLLALFYFALALFSATFNSLFMSKKIKYRKLKAVVLLLFLHSGMDNHSPTIQTAYDLDSIKMHHLITQFIFSHLIHLQGTPFADICEITDVPEGLIVRTIVRLDETCREFKNAAAIMGNSALYKKMETASNAIKRDIVFAASLYVTGV